MLLAAPTASGRGSVLPIFGARTAASAPTLPLPLRSRKRAKRAQAGERAHQRAAADIVGAPRRQEGAHIGRRQRGKLLQRRRAAEMLGEKGEELQHVAPIGFERLRRQPPLGAEMCEPASISAATLGRDEARASAIFRSSPRTAGIQAFRPARIGTEIPAFAGMSGPSYRRRPFPFLNRPESAHSRRHGQARRRCPGPGRARPGLFLPGARGA